MNRKCRAICGAALACVLALGLTACNTQTATVFDAAQNLGYGEEAAWADSTVGASTEIRKVYEEAKADGYTKSYVEFLKEIGYSASSETRVAQAALSAVAVTASFQVGSYSYGSFGKPVYTVKTATSSGSGVIYSLDKAAGNAYIITNYHVVYSIDSTGTETVPHISDNIKVWLYGSPIDQSDYAIPAQYVGGTMEYDLAVLKVERSERIQNCAARAMTRGNSDAIGAGDTVYAVGNPAADGFSVTHGIVSVDAEYISLAAPDKSGEISHLVIRTDAALNHGNSGGGLFNAEGELIGIVSARSEKSGVNGVGYAIPVNLAAAVVQNILDNGTDFKGALRAVLGVTVKVTDCHAVYSAESGRTYLVETVQISRAVSGSAASGAFRVGDVLYSLRINDGAEKVITRKHMVENLTFDVRQGDTVTAVVYRDGKLLTLKLEFQDSARFKQVP